MLPKDKRFDPCELDFFKEKMPGMDKDLFFRFIRMVFGCGRVLGLLDHYLDLYELSQGRFHILMHLFRNYEEGGLAPGELARKIGIKSASVTGLVDTLERNGMVVRRRSSEDRRKVVISLTERGHQFMYEFLPCHQENVRAFLDPLKEEELEIFAAATEKMGDAIQARMRELQDNDLMCLGKESQQE